MLSYKEIEVPDIGDFRSVPVVELLVQEGERVEVNTPLITVKTDKGPMDVPSPLAGKVQEMIVQVEDRVTRGSSILLLETEVEDPVPSPAPTFSEPALDRDTDLDPDPEGKTEPVWDIDPIIDPTTTEPRLPAETADETEDSSFDFLEEPTIPTLEKEIEPVEESIEPEIENEATEESIVEVPVEDEASYEGGWDAEDEAPDSAAAREKTEQDDMSETTREEPAVSEPVEEEIPEAATQDTGESVTVLVPDIGDFEAVEVIEVHVSAGDEIDVEDPLITLESDKATMDVPSSAAGLVSEVLVAVGDHVSEGTAVVRVGGAAAKPAAAPAAAQKPTAGATAEEPPQKTAPEPREAARPSPDANTTPSAPEHGSAGPASPPVPLEPYSAPAELPHASPAVRKFARELGVDLTRVNGSGPKGRILKEDVQRWVKKTLNETPTAAVVQTPAGAGIPEMPDIDFSQFGEVEKQPLSRIKKLTAANLRRAWLHVPHVTQHDEADISELEDFRQDLKKEEASRSGARITMLSFLMKACVVALKEFPAFNSSLEKGGENLIIKRYYHIGIAVDTNEGLVVPVVRDVDQKTIRDLAGELADISARARERKLSPKDLQGASFTISSLGGIGGIAFTPIVNAPEVAILGVSKSSMKPVYQDGEFVPRLILPLSLSYDHRVIDGAQAARFTSFLAKVLADVRRLLL